MVEREQALPVARTPHDAVHLAGGCALLLGKREERRVRASRPVRGRPGGRGRPPGLVADLPPEIHVGHAGVSPPYPAVEGGGRHLELALPRLGYLGGREPRAPCRRAPRPSSPRSRPRARSRPGAPPREARRRGPAPWPRSTRTSTCGCSGTSGSGTRCTPTATSGAWGTRPPGRPRRALPCPAPWRPCGCASPRRTPWRSTSRASARWPARSPFRRVRARRPPSRPSPA